MASILDEIITGFLEGALGGRAAEEIYFITISLILAFGILQTTGAVLDTDKPVVSVVSCSMYPQLHVGDIVVVKGQEFEDIEEGDVLVYSSKEAGITVGGESYSLRSYSGSMETEAGEISLVNINEKRRSNGEILKEAVVDINSQKYRLEEGKTYQINGETLTVDKVEGVSIPIVHRVVEKHETYLETKGDNNPQKLEFEKNITAEQVHGTSLFVVPRVGGLKLLVMDLVGFNGDRPFVVDSYPSCEER